MPQKTRNFKEKVRKKEERLPFMDRPILRSLNRRDLDRCRFVTEHGSSIKAIFEVSKDK